ncbi:DMT family transporter [Breoghania sp. L-A4]|uniref:DMT family transporter n=1 Tax=Breoghania sp. L-A4 TaxID=2304600 RepID=UPI000E35A39D|nr:DMT family transporter [Breoghania sp. L-A4]AXS41853.1 DMT family transporter [Breoghania sp. L-A4]
MSRPSITGPASPDTGVAIAAFAALVGGAIAMGASPVFVRFAEVGPFTSAAYRVVLALPLLWLLSRIELGRTRRIRPAPPEMAPPGLVIPAGSGRATLSAQTPFDLATVLAGVFFAGDLIFWHLSIVNTTVANATLLATMAPVWVVLGSGIFIGETVNRMMVAGLGLCILGAGALIGASLSIAPERLDGDIYGVITSVFFGAYFLAIRTARRRAPAALVLFRSSMVTAVLLVAAALIMETMFLPLSWVGVAALITLAVVSHAGGQGMLTFALGHLSAAFSSLVIFLEALAAAILGWLVFSEALTNMQFAGGAAILLGIWVARPRSG